jgi:amidohydrolase
VRPGPFTAAADKIEVRLTGDGGHTARPHLTADLVYALGRVIVDVPSLLDRRTDRLAGVSLVWGAVEAGEAVNAIPIEGTVRGTVRILNVDAWRDAPALITKLIHDVVAATGAEAEVVYTRGVPPVTNDAGSTALITEAGRAALGPAHVIEAPLSMAGEDFAFYLQQVRGAMFRLGVGFPGAERRFDLHQSDFDADERAIGCGVQVMVHTAFGALSDADH